MVYIIIEPVCEKDTETYDPQAAYDANPCSGCYTDKEGQYSNNRYDDCSCHVHHLILVVIVTFVSIPAYILIYIEN